MRHRLVSIALSALTFSPASTRADDAPPGWDLATYEISVTNATRNQQFTPVLFVVHRAGVTLFEVGEPASPELATLAEEGNTAPLADALRATPGVRDAVASAGLLDPGATVSQRIQARPFERISAAAMLIPTNDAFFALSGAVLPLGFAPVRLPVPAYDAGSERNDELCASIPGPFFEECGGAGGGAQVEGGEEGFVHIHAGIHGIGDLDAAERDWRNPTAMISIRRIR
jgi:hypothetical protein